MRHILTAALLGFTCLAATASIAADAALIEKGRQLFADAKLSSTGTACINCHPNNGHTDNKTYVGLGAVKDGTPDGRSTPTLWGAGRRSVYAWAGTAPALEGNIRGIIVNRMKGAEPTPETLAALAAYVRSLAPPTTGNVDEDGVPAAKAPPAVKRGFALFTGKGACGTCHVPGSFDKAEPEDVGTSAKFKVPALWAVSQTGPYFHDGRTESLKEAATTMWAASTKKAGKPSDPSEKELADLLAYLNSL